MPGIFWTHPDIIASRAYELALHRAPINAINRRVSLAPPLAEIPAAYVIAGSSTPGASGAPAARGR